jgi:tetratricopeptide (TPR) repeat protein
LGKVSAAIDQYNNAIRAAGTSKTAKPVRRKVAVVYTEQARQALLNNSYSAAAQHAARAVDADSTLSAGHYYLAASSSNMGDQQKAEEEYRKAIDTGGNDDFAVAARRLLSQLYIQRGDWYARNNQFDQAKAAYQSAVDLQDPDWAPVAQARVSNPGQ